jgi:hypothetical protein
VAGGLVAVIVDAKQQQIVKKKKKVENVLVLSVQSENNPPLDISLSVVP